MKTPRLTKPRAIVRSVADRYAAPGERIVEVSFTNGAGALIGLRQGTDERKPRIEVYRTDGGVEVIAPREDVARQAALDVAEDADLNWQNDAIQFPRLLAELWATVDLVEDGNLAAVAASMDLSVEDVSSLFDRATTAWEKIKAKT